MDETFDQFVKEFDPIENALKMRTLIRWNGRDLRERENLSEHTHLVMACAYSLYNKYHLVCKLNLGVILTRAMFHDSLEMLRGDILTITKDLIPGLRDFTDEEEEVFMDKVSGKIQKNDAMIVRLADLMACYKFIEFELRYPSNDFAIEVYKTTKAKFDDLKEQFEESLGIIHEDANDILYKFEKGYADDAGIDVVLDEPVTLMPMSTTVIGLHARVVPNKGHFAVLCSRSSAAKRGIIVANCPVDPYYNGEVMAIVHNISNEIVHYDVGQSFCQVVMQPFVSVGKGVKVKKEGRRTDGKFGSTDNR